MAVLAYTRTPRRRVLLATLVALLGSMAAIASGLSVDVALAQARAQERTVVVGRVGDRWLDTIKFRKIERATRNKTFGYNITYDLTGPDSHVLFWPRDKIDFKGRSPGYRLQVMPLGSGRLWYPDKITATSLPDVHRCILMIEGDYIKQADGVIAAMEGFATVAGLGANVPTLRAPVPKSVPHTTLPRPAPGATLPALAPAAQGFIALPALSASTRSHLLANATQAGRGGISPVGRAIQKHASRPGSFFTSAGGNAGRNTEIGSQFLDDLFANPSTSVTHRVHKVHGQVIDVRLPNGAGAQFTGEGTFVGLLECFTPR